MRRMAIRGREDRMEEASEFPLKNPWRGARRWEIMHCVNLPMFQKIGITYALYTWP
jgi:hypothetical protein